MTPSPVVRTQAAKLVHVLGAAEALTLCQRWYSRPKPLERRLFWLAVAKEIQS